MRDLVGRELGAQGGANAVEQLVGWLVALGQNNQGADLVADLRVGLGDNGRLDYRGMLLQRIFDLGPRNENPAAFEAVVTPSGDKKIPLVILVGEIAG